MMATNYCAVDGAGLLTFSGARAPEFAIAYYCGGGIATGVMRIRVRSYRGRWCRRRARVPNRSKVCSLPCWGRSVSGLAAALHIWRWLLSSEDHLLVRLPHISQHLRVCLGSTAVPLDRHHWAHTKELIFARPPQIDAQGTAQRLLKDTHYIVGKGNHN